MNDHKRLSLVRTTILFLVSSPVIAEESATAFRNSILQAAYFMLAARSLGLDCGPISGFDNDAIDAESFRLATYFSPEGYLPSIRIRTVYS